MNVHSFLRHAENMRTHDKGAGAHTCIIERLFRRPGEQFPGLLPLDESMDLIARFLTSMNSSRIFCMIGDVGFNRAISGLA